jgi:hypothetical protein
MHAPNPSIIFVVPSAGANNGWLRHIKPRYPQRPKHEAWRPQREIPAVDRADLKRRVAEALESHRHEREAMKAAAEIAFAA